MKTSSKKGGQVFNGLACWGNVSRVCIKSYNSDRIIVRGFEIIEMLG